jgi:hypothetical protein
MKRVILTLLTIAAIIGGFTWWRHEQERREEREELQEFEQAVLAAAKDRPASRLANFTASEAAAIHRLNKELGAVGDGVEKLSEELDAVKFDDSEGVVKNAAKAVELIRMAQPWNKKLAALSANDLPQDVKAKVLRIRTTFGEIVALSESLGVPATRPEVMPWAKDQLANNATDFSTKVGVLGDKYQKAILDFMGFMVTLTKLAK